MSTETNKPSLGPKPAAADEKLQKVLAALGFASRREIERWIEAGRVKVNGNTASLGDRVTADDQIAIDDRPVNRQQNSQTRILILNKPTDYVCTTADPEDRQTVFSLLPKISRGRWISIGRLDINSSGLLLFTNNGELANRLMHPKYEIDREYAVRVLGQVDEQTLQQLIDGVELEDGMARFNHIVDAGGQGANHWYHVTLKEGRNREVRRLWEAVGHQVSRLHRIRYGAIELPRGLRPGRFNDLPQEQINTLLEQVGLQREEIITYAKKKVIPAKGKKIYPKRK